MIEIHINDIDETWDDVYNQCKLAAQTITHETHEDVAVMVNGEKILETYIDWIPEINDFDVFTHYHHIRFESMMED